MVISSYWKNRENYTLLQVAYIACGEEPQTLTEASKNQSAKVVNTFREIKQHIINQLKTPSGIEFMTTAVFIQKPYQACEGIDFLRSTVVRLTAIELIDYLGMPNFLTALDEQQAMLTNTLPAYLDPMHPMFSDELNIAILAWNAVLECNPGKPKRGSRKKLIENWLETHHKDMPTEAKNRIATLLNPDKNGGAPPSD